MAKQKKKGQQVSPPPEVDPLDRAVAAGDVARVLAMLREIPHVPRDRAVNALRRALAAAAAARAPGEYLDELYEVMLAVTADLMAFSLGAVTAELQYAELWSSRGGGEEARARIPQHLALLERLHAHVMTLTKAWATCRHTMRIGEARPNPTSAAVAAYTDPPAAVPPRPCAVPSPAPEEPSASEPSMPRPRRRKRRRTDPASDVLPLLNATAELAETVEHDVPSALKHHCDAKLLETCGVDRG